MHTSPVSVSALRLKFWWCTVSAVVFILVMKWVTAPMSGQMIVQFELARTVEKAAAILADWSVRGWVGLFKTSVYLDFIFILLYVTSFFYGCRFIARLSGHYILKKAGDGFAWLAALAGVCDIIENIIMLQTVNTKASSSWTVTFTYHISVAKFSMLMIMALFMIVCVIIWALEKLIRRPGV